MDDQRRFTESEVKAILGRAVELEKVGAPIPGVAGSLSLAELRQVGNEAGISPALIEAAAADLELHGPPAAASWLGPPPRSRTVRLLNADLSSEDVELLLRLVEGRLDRPGMASEALGRVTWLSQSAQLTTEVSFSKQSGGTRIDAEQRYPKQMRPLLHVIPAAMGVTLATSLAAPTGIFGAALVAVAVAGGAVGAAVGRGIWEMVARTTARRTEGLANDIASAAAELGHPTSSIGGDQP